MKRQYELYIVNRNNMLDSVLVGSLLGDGSLTTDSEGYLPRFSVEHTINSLDYLRWKFSVLKPFTRSHIYTRSARKHVICGIETECKATCSFKTIGSRYFLPYYHGFYRDGRKVVPENIMNLLTPLAVAVWFMDDGYALYKPERYIRRIVFYTNGFSKDGVRFLCQVMKKVYDLDFKIHLKEGKYPVMCSGSKKTYYDFYQIVRKYIHPSMKYKIPASTTECTRPYSYFKRNCRVVRQSDLLNDSIDTSYRNKEWLTVRLAEGRTFADVAKLHGAISSKTVAYWAKRFNIHHLRAWGKPGEVGGNDQPVNDCSAVNH